MIKLMELIAGKFDLKETQKVLDNIFKHYGIKPKVKWANYTDKFAHYEADVNIMYVSKKLNKDPKEFLHTILHELKHALDAKKMGKQKYIDAYEMEQNMIAQGHKKGKHDPYSDNKFEEDAEKFANKEKKRWQDSLIGKKQMRF
jgi:AAA+ ATPase superfamily predicted ATPase